MTCANPHSTLNPQLRNLAAPKSYFRSHTSDSLFILFALSQTYYVRNVQFQEGKKKKKRAEGGKKNRPVNDETGPENVGKKDF